MTELKKYFGIVITIILLTSFYAVKVYQQKNRGVSDLSLSDLKLNYDLIDATSEVGINFTHEKFNHAKEFDKISPWIAAMGASVALVDPDNSGWYDIYFTTQKIGGKNYYYKNLRNGKFEEIGQKLNIASVNEQYPTYRAFFVDLENRGLKDLIILSYKPRVFKNLGENGFQEVFNHQLPEGIAYGAANFYQKKNSKYLNLILAPFTEEDLFYKPKSTLIMPDSFFLASNGYKKYFFQYDGNFIFSKDSKLDSKLQFTSFGHTIGVYDITGRSVNDIWMPVDFGYEKLFLNDGNDNYSEKSSLLMQKNYGFGRNGMGIDFADVDNDGKPLIFVSHIFEPFYKLSGNNLWKYQDGDYFLQQATERNVQDCGWAWGNKFVDLDNDARLDLVVVNGFFSQSKTKNYWYPLSVLEASTSSLQIDAQNWPPIKDASLAGYQKPCIFMNQGEKFVNIASKTPLSQLQFDGRAVVSIDYLNNGSPSLIFANQNGKAVFLKNIQKNKHDWIGFKLQSQTANRDAIGAEVRIELMDKTISRQLQIFNGYSAQAEDRLLIGLGENAAIKKIIIIWPNGNEQTLNEFSLNQYNLVKEI